MIRLVKVDRVRFNWNKGLMRQTDTFLCIPLLGIVHKLWTKNVKEEPNDQYRRVYTEGSRRIH